MKKKLLSSLAVLAVAAVATFNVSLDSKTNGLTDIMLSNVEALAQEPGDGSFKACYMDKTYDRCNYYNDSYYCPCGSL